MTYYDDDNILSLAQYCRSFNTRAAAKGGPLMEGESMSCRVCKNWDGNRCYVNAFDSVLNELEQD
jgi:hypothetical protein